VAAIREDSEVEWAPHSDYSSTLVHPQWLEPLLLDKKFNSEKTLILLTFDENSNYTINNQVYTVLLGNAVPKDLRGTIDPTFYTHYSALSTVEANWALGSLGRGDTNKTSEFSILFPIFHLGYLLTSSFVSVERV
jgi:hypothetical protein